MKDGYDVIPPPKQPINNHIEESKETPPVASAKVVPVCQEVESPSKKKIDINDFDILGFLGEGSYAKVLLVKHISTGKTFAMKTIEKKHMQKEKKEYQVRIERDVLTNVSHPNIIRLYWCFRDSEKLYFVLDYCSNGELYDILRRVKPLPYDLGQFYAGEIVNMLEYLHSKRIAHRDLKPENILINDEFHLKLVDFGTAKFFDKTGAETAIDPTAPGAVMSTRGTFVGTAEYVSPEVLLDQESGPPADLWALGCIIYQFYAGAAPFKNKTEYLTFEKILKGDIDFPEEFPDAAKDLVTRLLKMNPSERLGSGAEGSPLSYANLKAHKFFTGVEFGKLHKLTPPIDPDSIEKKKSIKIGVYSPRELSDEEEDGSQESIKWLAAMGVEGEEYAKIKEGVVLKKCGWVFYKKRLLILTTQPRLSYYGPANTSYKGDVMLSKSVRAEKINNRRFDVVTPNRTYFFRGCDSQSTDEWVTIINNAIKDYCL